MAEDTSLGKQVAKPYFVALVKEQASIRSEVGEINGEFGEHLKAAQDNSNLHLKAFRTVCQMNRMEEQKRNAFRDCLMLYLDFADEDLWGGRHVGDLDKMARAASGANEDEPEPFDVTVALGNGESVQTTASAVAAMDESVRNAQGIKELAPETHEANQKGKRGRAKAKAEKMDADENEEDAVFERGGVDYLAGKAGIIPDDLSGKPKLANRYLEGWSAKQVQRSKERDAAEFEKNPPKSGLPAGGGAGTYATH